LAAFGHVLTLISFVFAVSLAQLLIRISALVSAREKVKFSGLSGLAMANAILLVYMNWLAMWELHDAANWNLLSITVTFLFTLSICFICTLAAPQFLADEPVDLDAFYWKQRRTYYWSWIVCEALAIVANLLFHLGIKVRRRKPCELRHVPTHHSRPHGAETLGAVGRRHRAVCLERNLPRCIRAATGMTRHLRIQLTRGTVRPIIEHPLGAT